MSAFFWVAGALITLAGLALVAVGAVPHDGAFDWGALTAGTIAAVGGLLLIGIGATVRELRRIGRAIASRPSSAAHFDQDHAADFVEAHDPPRLPFANRSALAATPAALALAVEDAASEHLRAKIPPREQRTEGGAGIRGCRCRACGTAAPSFRGLQRTARCSCEKLRHERCYVAAFDHGR